MLRCSRWLLEGKSMIRQARVMWIILVSIFITAPALAQGTMEQSPENCGYPIAGVTEPRQFWQDVREGLISLPIRKPIRVALTGIVKPNSFPTEVAITTPSGNPQFDANCLVAILSSSRHDQSPQTLNGYWPLTTDMPGIKCSYKPKNKTAVVIFKIPTAVLLRYPGLFSVSELLNPENEKAICEPKTQKHQSSKLTNEQFAEITAYQKTWNSFFEKHPTATRAVIISEANRLNTKGSNRG